MLGHAQAKAFSERRTIGGSPSTARQKEKTRDWAGRVCRMKNVDM
jgi:hypothetical protein